MAERTSFNDPAAVAGDTFGKYVLSIVGGERIWGKAAADVAVAAEQAAQDAAIAANTAALQDAVNATQAELDAALAGGATDAEVAAIQATLQGNIDALAAAEAAQDPTLALKAELHDAVTLGATSDPALTLTGQELTLTLPAAAALDVVPTDGSTNGVQSDGVFDALALKADQTSLDAEATARADADALKADQTALDAEVTRATAAETLRELLSNKATVVRVTGTADDTAYPSEKAVRDAIDALDFGGDYQGSAATFAALPASTANGDWAILTADDGANVAGIYVTDGTAYSLAKALPDFVRVVSPGAAPGAADAGTPYLWAREDVDAWGLSRRVQRIFHEAAQFDLPVLNYVDRTAIYVRNTNNASGIGYTYRTDDTVSLQYYRADGTLETDVSGVNDVNVQPAHLVFGEKDGATVRLSEIPGKRIYAFDTYANANGFGVMPHDAIVLIRDTTEAFARASGFNDRVFPLDGKPNADWFALVKKPVSYQAADNDSPVVGRVNMALSNPGQWGAAPAVVAGEEYSTINPDGSGLLVYAANAATDGWVLMQGDTPVVDNAYPATGQPTTANTLYAFVVPAGTEAAFTGDANVSDGDSWTFTTDGGVAIDATDPAAVANAIETTRHLVPNAPNVDSSLPFREPQRMIPDGRTYILATRLLPGESRVFLTDGDVNGEIVFGTNFGLTAYSQGIKVADPDETFALTGRAWIVGRKQNDDVHFMRLDPLTVPGALASSFLAAYPEDAASTGGASTNDTEVLTGWGVRMAQTAFTTFGERREHVVNAEGRIEVAFAKGTATPPVTFQIMDEADGSQTYAQSINLETGALTQPTGDGTNELALAAVSADMGDYWLVTVTGVRPNNVRLRFWANDIGNPGTFQNYRYAFRVVEEDTVIETYSGDQTIGVWNGSVNVRGGAWDTINLGFDWTICDELRFDFVRNGSDVHQETIPVARLAAGADNGRLDYNGNAFHSVQRVSDTSIRVRVFNETAQHTLTRVRGVADAANGYVRPAATRVAEIRTLQVNGGANTVAPTQLVEDSAAASIIVELPDGQMIDTVAFEAANAARVAAGITAVVRDAEAGTIAIQTAANTGDVDLVVPFVAATVKDEYYPSLTNAGLTPANGTFPRVYNGYTFSHFELVLGDRRPVLPLRVSPVETVTAAQIEAVTAGASAGWRTIDRTLTMPDGSVYPVRFDIRARDVPNGLYGVIIQDTHSGANNYGDILSLVAKYV